MNFNKLNVTELTCEEQSNVEGGFLPMALACIAIIGSFYAAGLACGEGLRHYK